MNAKNKSGNMSASEKWAVSIIEIGVLAYTLKSTSTLDTHTVYWVKEIILIIWN